ncbi:MAG: TonB-dependent receptor [Lysobacterales bacterium]
MTYSNLHLRRKRLVITCTAALAASAFAPSIQAQAMAQPGESDYESDTMIEEITVTGTRIKGLDMKGAAQAVQIDRRDILESGADTIGQLMQDLTVTGGGIGTFTTSTAGALSGESPVGASSVSLRGLGVGSTLTLINGRRASVSAFAVGQASFIDVNSIPTSAIERVEVLLSGASASYGADAVAGVVNYVLRKDFEGVEVSASYGDSTAGSDNSRTNINLLAGWSNDRHHVMALVDYYQRYPLWDRDRKVSAQSIRPSQQGFFPSFNDLFLMFYDQTEEPQDGGCPEDEFGFGNFGEYCEVNTNQFTSVFDKYKSIGGLVTYQFEINDDATWYNEFIYQYSDSDGTSTPANFSRSPYDPESPLWPQALIDDIVEEGRFEDPNLVWEDFYGYPIYAWGKLPEPRAVSRTSKSLRFVSGVEWQINDDWNLDSAFTYGRNKSEQNGISGLVISEEFYNASLGNVCTDGTRVDRWDVDLVRPDAFYVGETCEGLGKTTLWYNPFSGQEDQAQGIDELIRTRANRNGKSEMWSLDATASGPLFEVGGRTVQSAIGVEWRREEVNDIPSGVAVATTFNPNPVLGFSSTSADASRNQWAAFLELFWPITDNFDIQLAGRYDHYDSFGGDLNPKVAFRWNVVDSLIMRGNYSTSYRAPSLAQVGSGTLLSSYTVDCSATPDACGGDPLADGQALLSEDVANDDLDPETAKTWGFGMLWSPTDRIEVSADYWSIKYDDVIGIDEDDFIRRALQGEYPIVGEGQLPTGLPGLEMENDFVIDAHFELSNLGFQDISGIDMTYTQSIDAGPGTLTLLADATYLIEYNRQSSLASPEIDEAGEYLYPEWLVNAKVRYSIEKWDTSFGLRYTDSYKDDPAPRTLDALGLPRDSVIYVDSWLVFDLNVAYNFTDFNFLSLNVRNLFNNDPPLVTGTSGNVDQINHSSMGRFITLRYTHRF